MIGQPRGFRYWCTGGPGVSGDVVDPGRSCLTRCTKAGNVIDLAVTWCAGWCSCGCWSRRGAWLQRIALPASSGTTGAVAEVLSKVGGILLHSGSGAGVAVGHRAIDHIKAILPLIQPQFVV